MASRQFNHLRHFCFSNFKRVNAADADPVPVNVEHDLHGLLARLGEKSLQHMDHELHGRVVVVQDEHLVERRLLRLGARLRDKTGADPAPVTIVAIASGSAWPARRAGAHRSWIAIRLSIHRTSEACADSMAQLWTLRPSR